MSKFWKRWKEEYLTGLRESHRLMQVPGSNGMFVAIGDLVLVHDKVEDLIKGEDSIVRSRGAVVRVQSGGGTTILRQPVQKLYPLELNLNTKATRSEDDDDSKQDMLKILVNVYEASKTSCSSSG